MAGEVRQEPSYLAIQYFHGTKKYPVSKLCAALHIPRCSYYKWLKREKIEKNPNAYPLFHSDRGFQYTSKHFRAKLDAAKMVQSMSRVGRCIDNGPMEGFWGILKSEMYYLRKFSSEQTLTSAIEEYIHFYNTKRYQKRLRCMTPMEFHAAA